MPFFFFLVCRRKVGRREGGKIGVGICILRLGERAGVLRAYITSPFLFFCFFPTMAFLLRFLHVLLYPLYLPHISYALGCIRRRFMFVYLVIFF